MVRSVGARMLLVFLTMVVAACGSAASGGTSATLEPPTSTPPLRHGGTTVDPPSSLASLPVAPTTAVEATTTRAPTRVAPDSTTVFTWPDVGLQLTVTNTTTTPFGDGWRLPPCPNSSPPQQRLGIVSASSDVTGYAPIGAEVVALVCDEPNANAQHEPAGQFVQLVNPADGLRLLNFTTRTVVVSTAGQPLPAVPTFHTSQVNAGRLTRPFTVRPDLLPSDECLCNWRFGVAPDSLSPRSTPDAMQAAAHRDQGGLVTMLFGTYEGILPTDPASREPPSPTERRVSVPAWVILQHPALLLPSCPPSTPTTDVQRVVGGCGATIGWTLKVVTDDDHRVLVDEASSGQLPDLA